MGYTAIVDYGVGNLRSVTNAMAYLGLESKVTGDAGELERMLADTAGQRPYEDWLRAFCQRKYNSDFSREMTRSVEAYLNAFEA